MLKTIQRRKANLELRRRRTIRKKVSGTTERPRLAFHKSLRHLYAQLIDDSTGQALVQMTTNSKANRDSGKKSFRNVAAAKALGAAVGQQAKDKGVEAVVFDRSGHPYHGVVKAFADAVREQGIKF